MIVSPSFSFSVAPQVGSCNGVAQSAGSLVTATAINLGRINVLEGIGAQKLTVSSNAAFGYVVYMRSAGPLAAAQHTFASVAGTNSSPVAFPSGAEAFGYTTSDSTLSAAPVDRFVNGGAKWAALASSDEEVATGAGVALNDTNCVAFRASAISSTPAGTYSATLIYTAVPTY